MLDWKEATLRGLRTFAQTFAGALASVNIGDQVTRGVAIEVGWKIGSAAIGAAIAGVIAFASNLGDVKQVATKAGGRRRRARARREGE